MTSMNTNMEGHLDEQPCAKKPLIGDSNGQQPGNDEPNGSGMNADEQNEELGTSKTSLDLPRPRHRKLPAELNQQIFLCFNPTTRRKFICGLGWDFYAMFRHRLLLKTIRVRNPPGNRWCRNNTRATISADGLHLHVSNEVGTVKVFAEQAFPIFGPQCRVDGFPGTICYYYEVKCFGSTCRLGFSDDDAISEISQYPNTFAIQPGGYFYECGFAGEYHQVQFIKSAILPLRKFDGFDVYGCGLILDAEDKLFIFFTMNGKLLTGKRPISPPVDRFFPAVKIFWETSIPSFEANFGDDLAKPFEYYIKKCPGLELDCI